MVLPFVLLERRRPLVGNMSSDVMLSADKRRWSPELAEEEPCEADEDDAECPPEDAEAEAECPADAEAECAADDEAEACPADAEDEE